MPPRFVRAGSTYLNFDLVCRGQIGQNMTGRKTVKLFDASNREIGELSEEAFLRFVEIVGAREAQQ